VHRNHEAAEPGPYGVDFDQVDDGALRGKSFSKQGVLH